ncbi:MAG: potassium/proton antiporter, partial [Ketobacter sp.]
ESGTNDPMAIFLTVTLVEILESSQSNFGFSILSALLQQMGLGLLLGAAGGWLVAKLLKGLNLPASLYPLFALAGGLSVFGLTNVIGGSGFLAIYIVGVIVGNSPLPHSNDIHRFHDGMAWLSQIGMFLMLGLLITPSHLPPIILPAIAIALVMIFVARPLAVVVSLLPFHFPWREQVFISWCGLRGAVPIILALFPSLAGMEHTKIFFELVFFVVLISLILQGWTIAPIARWLRIEVPPLAVEPEHLQVAIPTEQEQTLHIYDVIPECQAEGMQTLRLPLSEGAQLIGVIRRGVVIKSKKSLELSIGDRVMLLASDSTKDFGALFSPSLKTNTTGSMAFFGEFVISPEAALFDLAQVYGFSLPAAHEQKTAEEYINSKFHAKPVIGDRVTLEKVELVVRETKDGRITSVGLKLIM